MQATQMMRKKLELLEKSIPNVKQNNEFSAIKRQNLMYVSEPFDISSETEFDTFIQRTTFEKFINKISTNALEEKAVEATHIDRLLSLVVFFKIFCQYQKLGFTEKTSLETLLSKLEKKLTATIWWFGEQGKIEELDFLQEVRIKATDDIRQLITQSQEKILARNTNNLLDFFNLRSDELLQSIDNTIKECESIKHPDFQKLFDAKKPTRVIEIYSEIKKVLEGSYGSNDVKKWLLMPNKVFEQNTPIEYLIRGKVFQVLYFLRKVECD